MPKTWRLSGTTSVLRSHSPSNIYLSDGCNDDENFIQIEFIAHECRLFLHVGAIFGCRSWRSPLVDERNSRKENVSQILIHCSSTFSSLPLPSIERIVRISAARTCWTFPCRRIPLRCALVQRITTNRRFQPRWSTREPRHDVKPDQLREKIPIRDHDKA